MVGVVDAVRRLVDDVRRKRAAVVALAVDGRRKRAVDVVLAVDGRRKRAVDVVLVVVLLVVVVLGAFAAVAVGGDGLVVVALQQVDELVAMV